MRNYFITTYKFLDKIRYKDDVLLADCLQLQSQTKQLVTLARDFFFLSTLIVFSDHEGVETQLLAIFKTEIERFCILREMRKIKIVY